MPAAGVSSFVSVSFYGSVLGSAVPSLDDPLSIFPAGIDKDFYGEFRPAFFYPGFLVVFEALLRLGFRITNLFLMMSRLSTRLSQLLLKLFITSRLFGLGSSMRNISLLFSQYAAMNI